MLRGQNHKQTCDIHGENMIRMDWVFYLVMALLAMLSLVAVGTVLFYVAKTVSVNRLRYKRYFSQEGAFEGQEIFMYEELSNHSVFPMFQICVESYVTSQIRLEGVESEEEIQHFISRFPVVLPFTRIKRCHRAKCQKRGFYKLQTAKVEFAGMDVFLDSKAQLYIYPKELSIKEEKGINQYLQYSDASLLPVMEDVFSFAGVREYRSTDAFRRINYKATARRGELMVNQFDYMMGRRVMIYVNFQMQDSYIELGRFEEMMEGALSIASYLFVQSIHQGNEVGFRANSQMINGDMYVRFPMAGGRLHYLEVLREMAMIRPIYGNSFASIVEMDIREYMTQTECYFITSYVDEAVERNMEVLTGMNNGVHLIMLQDIV